MNLTECLLHCLNKEKKPTTDSILCNIMQHIVNIIFNFQFLCYTKILGCSMLSKGSKELTEWRKTG